MRQWSMVTEGLEIDEGLIRPLEGHIGKEAFIAYSPRLTEMLGQMYARPGLCLKVFDELPVELRDGDSLHLFRWGRSLICEATAVQNTYALHGLAPRVYAVVGLNGTRIAQVTDYVPEARPQVQADRALKVAVASGITMIDAQTELRKQLEESHRWRGSQIVDFGRFYFADPKLIENRLRKHIYRYHKKPHKEQIGYQPCPDLGVGGRRQIPERLKMMGINRDLVLGKTLLDIGCNHGEMTRQVSRLGCSRAAGIDHKYISGNRMLANWLGDWTVDYHKASLPDGWRGLARQTGLERWDIVLCLSVIGHGGGYPAARKYLKRLVGKTMFFSGQGNEDRAKYEKDLQQDYDQVTWLGYVTDNGRHPLWRCEVWPTEQ